MIDRKAYKRRLHNSIKEKTEYIMKQYPESRNNDNLLVALYMLCHHNIAGLMDCATHKVPAFATIQRCRRDIQKKGKYRGDRKIEMLREAEEAFYHEYYSPRNQDSESYAIMKRRGDKK